MTLHKRQLSIALTMPPTSAMAIAGAIFFCFEPAKYTDDT